MGKNEIIFKFISISCIALSIISFISIIFPFLIIESSIEIPHEDINLFELGNWTIPLILFNVTFFSLFILYKLKKLPSIIYVKISQLATKDLSKKVSFLIILVILSFYVIFSVDELSREEFELGDYRLVIKHIEDRSIPEFFEEGSLKTAIRFTLLKASIIIFDNVRIIPFIASISLLLLTYFITLELTKKRISGIISLTILLQSNLFLMFDTTATYENFWIVFYFFSFYLIFKKPIISHLSFITSLASKALTITFLPINLFTIFRKDFSTFDKRTLILSYSGLIILGIVGLAIGFIPIYDLDFEGQKFLLGFNELNGALRFDGLIILLFFPALIILMSKKGIIKINVEIILVGVIVMLISQPLLYSITPITIMPYRYIPLIVFMSIAVGMIFANSKNTEVD